MHFRYSFLVPMHSILWMTVGNIGQCHLNVHHQCDMRHHHQDKTCAVSIILGMQNVVMLLSGLLLGVPNLRWSFFPSSLC